MDKKELFDGFEESIRRARQYADADWEANKREGQEIHLGVTSLMDRDPAGPESLEVFRRLGSGYVEDERFAAFDEQIKPERNDRASSAGELALSCDQFLTISRPAPQPQPCPCRR